jgi:hypothetical protein
MLSESPRTSVECSQILSQHRPAHVEDIRTLNGIFIPFQSIFTFFWIKTQPLPSNRSGKVGLQFKEGLVLGLYPLRSKDFGVGEVGEVLG